MRNVEYRVLEYARSEDEVKGIDFLVVLRLSEGTGSSLRACILDTWKNLAAQLDDRTIEDLDAFVYDLRQRLVADQSATNDGFFEAIGDLNIGPLRTSQSGSFFFDDFGRLPFLDPDRPGELVLLPQENINRFIAMSDSS